MCPVTRAFSVVFLLLFLIQILLLKTSVVYALGDTQVNTSAERVFQDIIQQARTNAEQYLASYGDNAVVQRPVYQGVVVYLLPTENRVKVAQVIAVVNTYNNHGVYISLPLVFPVTKDGDRIYHVTDVRDISVEYFKLGSTTLLRNYFTKDTEESPFLRFRTIFAGDKDKYAPGRYIYIFGYSVHNIYETIEKDGNPIDLFYYTFFRQEGFTYPINEVWVIAPSGWLDMELFVDSDLFSDYEVKNVSDKYSLIHFKAQDRVETADLALYYQNGTFKDTGLALRLRKQGEELRRFKELLTPYNPEAKRKIRDSKILSLGTAILVGLFIVYSYKKYGEEQGKWVVMPEYVVPDKLKQYNMFLLAWLYYYEKMKIANTWFIKGLVAELFRLAQLGILKFIPKAMGLGLEITEDKLAQLDQQAGKLKTRLYDSFKQWLRTACKKCSKGNNPKTDEETQVCRVHLGGKCAFRQAEFVALLKKAKSIRKELEALGLWQMPHKWLWGLLNIVFGLTIFGSILFLLESLGTSAASEINVPDFAEFYGVFIPFKDLVVIHAPWIALGIFWFFVYNKMGKLTKEGLELRRALLGLAEYIKQAEAHRIEVLGGKNATAQELLKHFEDILPFAVLFGLQDKWVQLLKEHMNSMGDSGFSFRWYAGGRLANLQYLNTHITSIETAINTSVVQFKASYYARGGSRISGGRVMGGGFSGGASSGGW